MSTDEPEVDFESIFGGDIARSEVGPDASDLDIDALFRDAEETPGGTSLDSTAQASRFDGDTSELPAEVCWTLQELLAAPHITEPPRV